MWEWSVEVLRTVCDPVIVVIPNTMTLHHEEAGVTSVVGGATRQASIAKGLAGVETERVVIHDAARPLVTLDILESVLRALDGVDGGAFAAVQLRDTVAQVKDGLMQGTIDRRALWRVQTPQAFWTTALRVAHERALSDGIVDATDDAQLVARGGYRVAMVPGDERNIKVTYAEDLMIASALLAEGR